MNQFPFKHNFFFKGKGNLFNVRISILIFQIKMLKQNKFLWDGNLNYKLDSQIELIVNLN